MNIQTVSRIQSAAHGMAVHADLLSEAVFRLNPGAIPSPALMNRIEHNLFQCQTHLHAIQSEFVNIQAEIYRNSK